ncbi:acyl-ACP--UDP-N-acetylglucosamine O-acyltransferase, partial [Acidobacteriota bacterium]
IMAKVHPTAIVDKNAEIGENVEIGAYTVIGSKVKIRKGSKILDHVHIEGNTQIGENNIIYPFTALGTPPQDLGYQGEDNKLEIGNNNIIRTYVDINIGTTKGGGVTRIGNSNYLMAFSHIAHDCKVGNNNIFINNASLAGHALVEDFANLSFGVGVHQFGRVGAYSLIGGGAHVSQDVPPYAIVIGSRPFSIITGVNSVGMRRNGIARKDIETVKKAFKILFWENLNSSQAIKKIENTIQINKEIAHLLEFIKTSKRGIVKRISKESGNFL